MDIAAILKTFIYVVSSSLLYPTLALLSFLVIWVLILSGSIAAESITRARIRRTSEELQNDPPFAGIKKYNASESYTKKLEKTFTENHLYQVELIEKLLQEESFKLLKSTDNLRILVRLGPGLGLIGTLIPMGTGLAALGQGDITKLTSDLVIAFTTTVVGLAVGLTAYFLYWKKRRWVEADIRNMEFITEIMVSENQIGENRDEIHKEKKTVRIG